MYIYWRFSLNLSYLDSNFYILDFTCACVSSVEKGKKSLLVPLKHSFSGNFQKLQTLFWNWPRTRPSNCELVVFFEYLKKITHTFFEAYAILYDVSCVYICINMVVYAENPNMGLLGIWWKFSRVRTFAVKLYNAIFNWTSCSELLYLIRNICCGAWYMILI